MPSKNPTDGGGAWGLGLFQSDWDYNYIQMMSGDAGLTELETEDAKRLGTYLLISSANTGPTSTIGSATYISTAELYLWLTMLLGKKAVYATEIKRMDRDGGSTLRTIHHERADQSRVKRKDGEIYYSVYANLCSSPKRVRQYLEKTEGRPFGLSMLQAMIFEYQDMAEGKIVHEDCGYERPGYLCVLFAMCAMSLGCKLPLKFLDFVRSIYTDTTRVGLMRDALKQVRKALGPDGYKSDGTPYDFGKHGIDITGKNDGPPVEDRYVESMLNVPSPSGMHPGVLWAYMLKGGTFKTREKTGEYLDKKFKDLVGNSEHGNDVCGGCGAIDGEDGKVLVKCAKCQKRQYCGKECQKSEWAQHKKVCRSVVEELSQLALNDLD